MVMHGVCRVFILAILPMAHERSVSAGWLDVDLVGCRGDSTIEQSLFRHDTMHRRVLVVWNEKQRIFVSFALDHGSKHVKKIFSSSRENMNSIQFISFESREFCKELSKREILWYH